MAKRREVPRPEGSQAQEAQTKVLEGPEPQATLTVRGTADSVKKQLGIQTDDKSERKPEAASQDDEKKKFVEALRNPKYIIRVKRQTPREFNGQKTNVEVWSAELPMGYQEIQEEVTKDCGGEKYRVAIIDPASNNTIAADTFVVDGDPIVPESDMSQAEIDRVIMRGEPKSAADMSEESLERRARLTAKQIEVEAYEEQLADARKRRENGGKPAPQDNTRVDDLERRLTEAKHQAELEARDRKHTEEMKELRALIARTAKPEGQSETALILAQMQKSQEAADKRFEALQRQMQDDKSNAILEELRALRNKPSGQGGSLLEQAEAMLKLRKIFGWGGNDADEDEDDEDDDRPWWEKALDKLGGKFGDKLLEKFTAMEEKGETVSREEFMRGMMEHADQVAAAAVKKQLPAPRPANILPPPPAPGPTQSLPPAPVTALPPPPPPGAAPQAVLPPPPAPTATPQVPQALTIEQEIVIRVGGVLEMIEREIELRPNEYLWNYEGAYNALPESVLEKVCAAPDPVAMIDAFAIPNISADALAALKAKISGNPRILAWLKVGHDELKEWFSEKMKDPKFDPFADDGPEGEGE